MKKDKKKVKPKYSIWSNIRFSISTYWDKRTSAVIWCGAGTFVRVALPFTGIYLPKVVIDSLSSKVSTVQFISSVGGMVILLMLLNFIKSYSDRIIDEAFGTYGSYFFAAKGFEKMITMDYELLEDPGWKIIEDKAVRAVQSNHTAAMNLPRNLSNVIVNLLGLFLYGSVIIYVSPWIIVLLVLSAYINWLVLSAARRYEVRTRETRAKISRKVNYLINSMKTLGFAKDIRLYSMTDWLKSLSMSYMNDKESADGRVEARNMAANLTDGFLILLRDGAAYTFLIYLLLQNQITLGDFVLIFAAIGTLAGWVSGILVQSSELMRSNSEMSDLREYYDTPDRSNTGLGKPLPVPEQLPPGFTLTDIGYTYPNAEKPSLHNINVTIKPGEHIAIVGVNGAGKTTLVKLLCGLYQPKYGEIRLNDTDIKEYNRDDYFTLFSTVFQDIHLTTTGIIGNISSTTLKETDQDKVRKCLQLSGLYEKVQTLPNKEFTGIVRETDEEAVELSGGEKQKLALARALYKDAPVIILDEPTAALDPIAESEVYRKFAELTKGKTSVFISHRLASTRFCDRILFIDEQTIAEEGTHDELMRLGGKYAHMYNIQSSYYTAAEEV